MMHMFMKWNAISGSQTPRVLQSSYSKEHHQCPCDGKDKKEEKGPRGQAGVKALVWFWWIDETLSANLVYQVIMK